VSIDDDLLRHPRRLIDALVEDVHSAWDEREGLGEELTRALERYLLLQVIDQVWPEHQERCAESAASAPDAQVPGLDLANRVWEQFFHLLFNVEVEIEDDTPPAPDPSAAGIASSATALGERAPDPVRDALDDAPDPQDIGDPSKRADDGGEVPEPPH